MPVVSGTISQGRGTHIGPLKLHVHVRVTADSLSSWDGSFVAPTAMPMEVLRLTLADGRQGEALITSQTMTAPGRVVVMFKGSGPLAAPRDR